MKINQTHHASLCSWFIQEKGDWKLAVHWHSAVVTVNLSEYELSPDNEETGNKLFWIRRNLIEVKLNIWTQETINIISIDCSQAAHRDMVVATLHSTELLWAGWQVFISASSKNVYGNETGARFT